MCWYNFYETFYHLEDKGSLNPLNEVDLFCLHYVFLPHINKTLQEFTECWNNHNLSSEHNFTPNQRILPSTPQMLHSSGNSNDQQQMDVEEEVAMPRVQFKPCYDLLSLLNTPLQPTNGFAYNLCGLAVQVLGRNLALNCINCI